MNKLSVWSSTTTQSFQQMASASFNLFDPAKDNLLSSLPLSQLALGEDPAEVNMSHQNRSQIQHTEAASAKTKRLKELELNDEYLSNPDIGEKAISSYILTAASAHTDFTLPGTPKIDCLHKALLDMAPAEFSAKSVRKTLTTTRTIMAHLQTIGGLQNHRLLGNIVLRKFPDELQLQKVPERTSVVQLLDLIEKKHKECLAGDCYPITTKMVSVSSSSNSVLQARHAETPNQASRPMKSNGQQRPSTVQNHQKTDGAQSSKTGTANKNNINPVPGQKIPKSPCVLCDGDHFNNLCPIYKTPESRIKRLKGLKRCLRCLNNNHQIDSCICKERTCNNCGKKGHHKILCSAPTNLQRQKRHPWKWQEKRCGKIVRKIVQEAIQIFADQFSRTIQPAKSHRKKSNKDSGHKPKDKT